MLCNKQNSSYLIVISNLEFSMFYLNFRVLVTLFSHFLLLWLCIFEFSFGRNDVYLKKTKDQKTKGGRNF